MYSVWMFCTAPHSSRPNIWRFCGLDGYTWYCMQRSQFYFAAVACFNAFQRLYYVFVIHMPYFSILFRMCFIALPQKIPAPCIFFMPPSFPFLTPSRAILNFLLLRFLVCFFFCHVYHELCTLCTHKYKWSTNAKNLVITQHIYWCILFGFPYLLDL